MTTPASTADRAAPPLAWREAGPAGEAFLLRLSDALRPLSDPLDVQEATARLLGEAISIERVVYVDFEPAPDGNVYVVYRDVHATAPEPGAIRHRADEFGATLFEALQAGSTVSVSDVDAETRLTVAERVAYREPGIRAFVAVPLVKNGRLVASLVAQDSEPRTWSPDQIALIEETAERTWGAVERSRAEAALRESEEKYRQLFDSIDEGFALVEVILDDDGRPSDFRFIETNEAFERQILRKNIVGRQILDILPAIGRTWIEAVGDVARSGESVRSERYLADVDRWFSVYLARVGSDGSRLVTSLLSDVTERKLVEEALRESQTRLRLALDAAGMGTFVWYPDEDRSEADQKMLDLFGLHETSGLTLAAALTAMIHPEDRRAYAEAVGRAVDPNGPGILRTDVRVRHPDGSEHWIAVTGQVAFGGRPRRALRMAGTGADVTVRKRIEVALREREGRLEASRTELRAALAVKDEFLGLVSHELRTPMTVILGMSSILTRDDVTLERVREIAPDIHASAAVLNGLVETMLLLARLDRDEAEKLREPTLLRRAVGTVVDRQRSKDPTRTYSLEVTGPATPIDVNPDWLERVIENLLSNAAKYSEPGGPIRTIVEVEEHQVRCLVLDEGAGLGEDDVGQVFEPFFRSAAARSRAPGSGLGLVVSKRIVELMGGQIWARRREGGGAEFGFSLPGFAAPDA